MRKLLLITGDLAAGKSTFAGILAERYGVMALCKDRIKEILSDTIGFADREENKKLFEAAVALMTFLLAEAAKSGEDLILEANFHEQELERLLALARENRYETLTLVLRGDVSTLHRRYLRRMREENRHPAHLSTTLDVFEDFQRYTDFSRMEAVRGNALTVRADDFAYQTDAQLLGAIDALMGRASDKKRSE